VVRTKRTRDYTSKRHKKGHTPQEVHQPILKPNKEITVAVHPKKNYSSREDTSECQIKANENKNQHGDQKTLKKKNKIKKKKN
jgi:hypothetical protein